MNDDKYEAITLIIKSRSDGDTWFDIVSNYISQDCQGTEEEGSCTCGLVSMGGTSGTINQCWKYLGDTMTDLVCKELVDPNYSGYKYPATNPTTGAKLLLCRHHLILHQAGSGFDVFEIEQKGEKT